MHNQTNCQSPQKQAQIRKRGTSFDAQFDAFEFEPWAKTEISKPLSGNPRRRSIEITRRRMIARDLAQIQSARRAAKQAVHSNGARPGGIASPAHNRAPRRHAVKKPGNASGGDSDCDPASDWHKQEDGLLCRQYFDPELGEKLTEFKLETPRDIEAYLARRGRIARGF
jgi:hypothetical protein